MTIIEIAAKRVLQLMDSVEDGGDMYQAFLQQVASEHKLPEVDLVTELVDWYS